MATEDAKETESVGAATAAQGEASVSVAPKAAPASVNRNLFYSRLKGITERWKKARSSAASGTWGEATALVFLVGSAAADDFNVRKLEAIQGHLFSLFMSDVLMLVLPDAVHILTYPKKCKILAPLTEGGSSDMTVVLHERDKSVGDGPKFEEFIKLIKAASDKPKIGIMAKEEQQGAFADGWKAAVTAAELESVDIAAGIGLSLAVKDEEGIKMMDKAADLASKIFRKCLMRKVETVVDEDLKATHESMAEEVETLINDTTKIKELLKSKDLPKDSVECPYFPIIQSGGDYDLKVSAMSNNSNMKFDVIICSMGLAYKSYNVNMARTILVDPPKKVMDAYKLLSDLYDKCMEAMKAGEPLRVVAETAKNFLERKNPDYIQYLPKTLGSAIGLEFRDATLLLNSKNAALFKNDMFFNLVLGFQNVPLTDKDRRMCKKDTAVRELQTFSLLLSDTVRITPGNLDQRVITRFDHALSKIQWEISEEGNDQQDEEEEEKPRRNGARVAQENILEVRLRSRAKENEDGLNQGELDRRASELLARKTKEKARKWGDRAHEKEEEVEAKVENIKAYDSTADYPRELKANQIFVDMDREAVILPVHGMHVPFHISTIKNVVQPEADQAGYLRLNFYTPGQTLGKDTPEVMQKLIQAHSIKYGFIKEMMFRSLDQRNLNHAFRLIQELRKRARQREKVEKEEADLVEQEKLIPLKTGKPPRLSDLTMRPHLSGRKTTGRLEAHTNGLRFVSKKNEHVDVMYSNIRVAIFQPCEKDLYVIIHFHLKNPIMINNKKCQDVQFLTEAVEAVINMEGNRRSAYDPDEYEDEQRERQMKLHLNQMFKDFADKVENLAETNGYRCEFDVPYRELSFTGRAAKEMVEIHFSVHCLLSVVEMPFFVMVLEDIEHVHFERVTASGKAFDMTLILTDFSKEPPQIAAIPKKDFLHIQDTLLERGITYTYGSQTYKWRTMLDEFKDDPRFYLDTDEDGEPKPAGWKGLNENEAEQDEDEEDDADSEFEVGSEEEEEEEDEDSDFEEEEEEEDESDYVDDEEEGEDWDEMEREAAAADKAKTFYEDDLRRGGGGGGGGGKRGRDSGKGRGPPAKKSRR